MSWTSRIWAKMLVGMLMALPAEAAMGFEFGGSLKADAKAGTDGKASASAKGEADGVGEGAAQGDFYQMDMKPGLSFAKERSSSKLADAARNRTSISIGANPKPKAMASAPIRNSVYTVKPGDTLWDICDAQFGDPYVWPRIWSYNVKVTNPNWIYPGDLIFLLPPNGRSVPLERSDEKAPAVKVAAARQAGDAILSRNRGFVDKRGLEQAGRVRGAQKEVMMLSQFDEAYVEFKKDRDVQVGDEFAAFRILKDVEPVDDDGTDVGKLVEILGVVRVISYDKDNHVARVVIDESIGPIERNTMVGPVHRRFELVPSRKNEKEMYAHVIAHLDNTVMWSKHQIVFVDKGSRDGVKEGNRFFAIKKRDGFRESNDEKDDNEHYPYEVKAELRVLEARQETSTCLVTGATGELEDGQKLEMVKGY